jgi:hypothetical protein
MIRLAPGDRGRANRPGSCFHDNRFGWSAVFEIVFGAGVCGGGVLHSGRVSCVWIAARKIEKDFDSDAFGGLFVQRSKQLTCCVRIPGVASRVVDLSFGWRADSRIQSRTDWAKLIVDPTNGV